MRAITRSFVEPDRAALVKAIDAVCAEGDWMNTSCFQPTEAWNHALEAPACSHHLLLVAEDEGLVVGWCRLFPVAGCSGSTREAELGIGLRMEYRERGLGKALVNQALDWAATTGTTCVTLTTRVDNFRAIHLFENCGFTAMHRETDSWIKMICQSLPREG